MNHINWYLFERDPEYRKWVNDMMEMEALPVMVLKALILYPFIRLKEICHRR